MVEVYPPLPTTIYCLKNPIDKKVFYVGKTTKPLKHRLSGHIRAQRNGIIMRILREGKRPVILPLEICTGYHAPLVRERYWIAHFNKRKNKLCNVQLTKNITIYED